MHCLLEPIDDERLRVTDIVTEVGAEGPRTRISDYTKVRISPTMVAGWGTDVGFAVAPVTIERGLVTQLLQKPR